MHLAVTCSQCKSTCFTTPVPTFWHLSLWKEIAQRWAGILCFIPELVENWRRTEWPTQSSVSAAYSCAASPGRLDDARQEDSEAPPLLLALCMQTKYEINFCSAWTLSRLRVRGFCSCRVWLWLFSHYNFSSLSHNSRLFVRALWKWVKHNTNLWGEFGKLFLNFTRRPLILAPSRRVLVLCHTREAAELKMPGTICH